ncbi:MAG: tRNA(Met) cytidine acetyltransferase, partial [Candidatus Korarchaeum sp.]
VHISPSRNPVTGEYSVLVMKPLSSEASKLSEEILREFKRRLLSSLHDVYFSLNPSVARLLLKGRLEGGKVKLSNSQRSRLGGYLRGTYVYELASDSIYEVVRGYFWQGLDCLTPREESMLIAKVLQGKPWETIRSRFGVKEPYEVMREIVFNLVRCLDSLSDQA